MTKAILQKTFITNARQGPKYASENDMNLTEGLKKILFSNPFTKMTHLSSLYSLA